MLLRSGIIKKNKVKICNNIKIKYYYLTKKEINMKKDFYKNIISNIKKNNIYFY